MSFTVVKDSYPNIVKDGLVLNVDAGSRLSYSGSGTTWSDISGNGNNGTLTNGPTYSSANGGSIVFDGTNDYAVCSASSIFNFGTGDCSIEAWIYWDGTYSATVREIYATGGSGSVDQFGIAQGAGLFFGSVFQDIAANYPPINAWSHVAASRIGTTIRLYINGVQTVSGTQASAIGSSSVPAYIGFRGADGNHPFKGNISSLRIYKGKGLSAAEVLQNYNALLPRYYSIVTSGLVLNLDAGNPNSYSPPRSDQYASSLVLAVPMNGANNGTTFTDQSAIIKGSGSAKTVTNNGSIPTLTAQSKFYGSSAYISNAATQSLTFGNYGTDFQFTGDFTIECWVYPTTSGATDGSLFVLQSGGNNYFAFNFDPGTQFNIYNNSTGPSWSPSVSSVITGQWNHLAFVRSGSTQQIFVNGVSIGTNTASGTLGYSSADFARIGGGGSGALNSYIQDFRIYKGVAKYTTNFKPPSISSGVTISSASGGVPILNTTDDYGTVNGSSGTTWTDISGNGNTGTLTNGPTYNGANYGSIVFDGSNQYGTIPYNSNFAFGTGDFTIEVWMRMTSTTNSYQVLGGTHSAGTGGSGWYYYARNAFQSNVAGGQSFGYNSDIQNNQSTISTNVWIQMVARRISGVLTFYQNTNQGASISFTDNIINGNALIIGNLGGSGFPTTYGFIGNISVVRVYKGIGLTATEVLQNYNALKWRYGI